MVGSNNHINGALFANLARTRSKKENLACTSDYNRFFGSEKQSYLYSTIPSMLIKIGRAPTPVHSLLAITDQKTPNFNVN